MTDYRRGTLHAFVLIALVVIGHAALIAALALAGEWRVWRFLMNITAQLYALAAMGWMGWHVFAAPARHPRVSGAKSIKAALERWIGPPMAAPETAAMRALRFVVVASALASALAIAGIDLLVARCGRAATGATLLVLILAAALSAAVFFYRKIRLDDAWLRERGFARDGTDE